MSAPATSFEAALDAAIGRIGGPAVEPSPPRVPAALRRRRGAVASDFSRLARLTLVDDDGMLRWVYEAPPRLAGGRRRSGRRSGAWTEGEPVRVVPIQDLPSNQVLQSIAVLDSRLTPDRGLRQWKDGALVPVSAAALKTGRVLLLVHGTFSKSDMFFTELQATEPGRQYLADAERAYTAILAFDHPTLAVSPWINALDLEAALAGSTAPLDVVCHSRGGLVVAWWLRLARRDVARVLFVGAPLAGTTLASPAALRQALDHLTSAARVMTLAGCAAGVMVPFMAVVAGLAQTLGKVLQLGTSLPLADVAVLSVPGLASQSRVSNNAEMLRLFGTPWPSRPELHAVVGNFRPTEIDAGWRFWQRMSNVREQLKYGAAGLFFDSPNDLVVDTLSMSGPRAGDHAGLGLPALVNLDLPAARVTRFDDASGVHHTNYFAQPETVSAMRGLL